MITTSHLLTRSTAGKLIPWLTRPIVCIQRTLSNGTSTQKATSDTPVKFSASKAATWNARNSRGDIQRDAPWFESYVVLSSIAVFMLYFCVFREENDFDVELSKTLYDRIPGLEKKQLELVLSYNESQGLDTTDLRNRLQEIATEDPAKVDN